MPNIFDQIDPPAPSDNVFDRIDPRGTVPSDSPDPNAPGVAESFLRGIPSVGMFGFESKVGFDKEKQEAAWERQQERNRECPPPSIREQYMQAGKEKRGLR